MYTEAFIFSGFTLLIKGRMTCIIYISIIKHRKVLPQMQLAVFLAVLASTAHSHSQALKIRINTEPLILFDCGCRWKKRHYMIIF